MSDDNKGDRQQPATPSAARKKQQRERYSALEKAIIILETLSNNPHPVGLPDIHRIVKFPRQTVHRVLKQLESNGLVVRDPSRDRYSVGPRLSKLALTTLCSSNQSAPIRSILAEVVRDLEETCNIGVLDDLEFLYLERIECDWSLRVNLQAGSRVPAHCVSGGKVMLAFQDDEWRRQLLRSHRPRVYTDNTLTRIGDLEVEFAKIRQQGYALNDQEYSLGILGVAVPVLDDSGRVLAALAVHGPKPRFTLKQAREAVPKLQRSAKRLAKVWNL